MVKICQTGLLKLNFKTRPKKRIFRFLSKISAGHGRSWNFFFANFQILGPLGCQGWVAIPQNVKKSQNHCTLVPIFCCKPSTNAQMGVTNPNATKINRENFFCFLTPHHTRSLNHWKCMHVELCNITVFYVYQVDSGKLLVKVEGAQLVNWDISV